MNNQDYEQKKAECWHEYTLVQTNDLPQYMNMKFLRMPFI